MLAVLITTGTDCPGLGQWYFLVPMGEVGGGSSPTRGRKVMITVHMTNYLLSVSDCAK